MSAFFNLSSLVLGLAAWVLAVLAVMGKQANKSHRFSVSSFSLCSVSLLLQIFEVNNRVNLNDFSAIIDTIRAVILAACVLVGVTVILNIAALIRNRKSTSQHNA